MKRFWDKVNRTSDPSDCWEWNAYTSKKGYGHFSLRNNVLRAHRLAYELCKGPIPPNMYVLHKCNNTKCCNPSHLRIGSQLDNMKDRENSAHTARGLKNGRCKLSSRQIEDIRMLISIGRSQREIATQYGVTHGTIGAIHRGITHNITSRPCG
jgi:hypothetical protein